MALTNIGLSYDDFCRLTPEEFSCCCKAYNDKLDADREDEWKRMRMLATIAIQPHIKNKLTPEKLLPLPWDRKEKHAEVPQLSKEDSKARYAALMAKMRQKRNG